MTINRQGWRSFALAWVFVAIFGADLVAGEPPDEDAIKAEKGDAVSETRLARRPVSLERGLCRSDQLVSPGCCSGVCRGNAATRGLL
jgi:hypothetical protein